MTRAGISFLLDAALKQRLVGAVVLVALAVIFLPMLLDGSGARDRLNEDIAIPEQPEAPESRLEQEGAGSGAVDGDAGEASLATDDYRDGGTDPDDGADEPAQAEPEADTEDEAADAPASEEESGSDAGAANADATAEEAANEGLRQGWVVQVGSFQLETNAVVLRDRLREAGFDANAEKVETDGGTVWRVLLGPVAERADGEALERRIEDHRGSDALLMEYSG